MLESPLNLLLLLTLGIWVGGGVAVGGRGLFAALIHCHDSNPLHLIMNATVQWGLIKQQLQVWICRDSNQQQEATAHSAGRGGVRGGA